MKLFALSDLHLSLAEAYSAQNTLPVCTKPMDVFGPHWQDCFARMDANWRSLVSKDDVVLIAGDISWGMTVDEAQYDLDYLASLPGRKILIKGNHDYWWSSLSKVQQAAGQGLHFLQHSAVAAAGHAICGTRGWLSPAHADFKEAADRTLYRREMLRLQMALEQAQALQLPIIAMLHYPPLLHEDEQSEAAALLEQYGVKLCIYGHIHGEKASAFSGIRNGVEYLNTSMDRLNFTPLLLAEHSG